MRTGHAPQPWHGKDVTWTVDGEEFTAAYNPAELTMLRIDRERGASRRELEAVHLLKAIIPGTCLIDAEAAA